MRAAVLLLLALCLAGCAPALTKPIAFGELPPAPDTRAPVGVEYVVGPVVIAHEGKPAPRTGRLLSESEWDAVLAHDAGVRGLLEDRTRALALLRAMLLADRLLCETKDEALIGLAGRLRRARWEALGLGFLAGVGSCGAAVGTAVLRL